MKQVLIKTIKKCNEPAFRYDISVAKNSNFFANDILVHNSLIIAFWYNGEFILASRGSFTSDHALKAREILDSKYPQFQNCSVEHVTYLFELTGFEQIVVSYPVQDLTLIGTIHTSSGNDVYILKDNHFWLGGLKRVKKFEGLDWKNIKNLNWKNSEWFVVRFSNGSRCKIKFEDYIRLHKVMTNISERKIWEALKDGTPISSILENVPDEFFGELKQTEDRLLSKFRKIELEYSEKYRKILRHVESSPNPIANYRKTFAYFASKAEYPQILFSMFDGKDYSQKIWKILEP